MSAILIKNGDHFMSSAHKEYILSSAADVVLLPGNDKCAIGSIAYIHDLSKLWILGEDNVWHEV